MLWVVCVSLRERAYREEFGARGQFWSRFLSIFYVILFLQNNLFQYG